MKIVNSTIHDIDRIFELYDLATAYQKQVAKKHWQGFERTLVEREISEQRQWKILVNDQIACVFMTAFNDPFIWKERDTDPSIYIHRIATDPSFRGQHFVKHIVAWARTYAQANQLQFIRLDTGSGNEKINNYYTSCGFTYLGIAEPGIAPDLPAHYQNGSFSLFEIKL